jgi:hypothetical protein
MIGIQERVSLMMIRKPWTYLFVCGAVLVVAIHATPASAGTYNFVIDPTLSWLTLSGNYSGKPLVQQGPGSLTTSYSGSMLVDLDNGYSPTTISILGSSAVAANSGSWRPQAAGGTGNAPANYGGKMDLGWLFGGWAYAAIRNLNFNITDGPESIVGGAFPSTQLFTIATGRAIYTSGVGSGDDDISGSALANASATNSTYSVLGSTATLTIPVYVNKVDKLTQTYTGTIVARCESVPEPTSLVLLVLGGLMMPRRRK